MSTDHAVRQLDDLDEHLERWVEHGLISPAQASQIVADEQAALAAGGRTGRAPMLTEALGYVGGVLVVVAGLLLTAQLWADLALWARLGLTAAAAGLLLGLGAALPVGLGTAAGRLHSAAWGLSAATVAFLLGLFAVEVLDTRDADTALVVATGVTAYSAVLWWLLRSPLQQAVAFVGLAATGAAALARVAPSGPSGDGLPALGILAVGAGWLYLGVRDMLAPRRFVLVLGAVGVALGAATVQMADWGRVVALVAVLALVGLALRMADLALLAVGAVGMFIVFPGVLMSWFPGAVAAPLALLLAGTLLVLAALRTLRHGTAGPG
ncbi:MAG: DUF2157 domain-containing protein [Mycobacteriales bacterium]|nr:DUF2157 domain-containing protein [Mycobacteriales bacterium]